MQELRSEKMFDRMLEKLPDHVTLLLIIVSGFLLARLTWMLFPAETQPLLADTRPAVQQAQQIQVAQARQVNYGEEIARYHLLGKVEAKPVIAEKPKELPETRLPLKLIGVYALPDEDAVAVIESAGKQSVVRVGDSIEGNGAVLDQVMADQIILTWKGKQEVLKMQHAYQGGAVVMHASMNTSVPVSAPVPTPLSSAVNHNDEVQPPPPVKAAMDVGLPANTSGVPAAVDGGASGTQSLGEFRNAVLNNNMRLLEVIRPSPVRENGQLIGFRVSPGSNLALFQQTGLQSGDIVTAVNGMKLDSPANGMQALQGLADAASANLTVKRGGEEISVQQAF